MLTSSTSIGEIMSVNRPGYHHGNLRDDLVQAALELLRRGSQDDLTLRAVARMAGVSQTAPYRHFSDKGALLAAVAETGFSKLQLRCISAMAKAKTPQLRLDRLGTSYVTFALEEPALYRLMFGAQLGPFKSEYPVLAAGAKQVYDLLRTAVAALVPDAAGSANQVETGCIAAWSLVHGLASLLIDRNVEQPPRQITAMVSQVTSLFAKGLASSWAVDHANDNPA